MLKCTDGQSDCLISSHFAEDRLPYTKPGSIFIKSFRQEWALMQIPILDELFARVVELTCFTCICDVNIVSQFCAQILKLLLT